MDAATCWFTITVSSLMEHEGQAIARGLRRRDPELLDHLIERYHYRLLRYLLYLTSSRATAEDLFQETWIRVLERGRQYDGRTKFATWLFAVARHLVIDASRRRQPQSLEALTEAGDERTRMELEAESETSAFDLVSQREAGERLGAALARLPATYREVLVLRFHEDMALEEIAAVVDAPLSTVKSRLYRGLDAMRRWLEGERA